MRTEGGGAAVLCALVALLCAFLAARYEHDPLNAIAVLAFVTGALNIRSRDYF